MAALANTVWTLSELRSHICSFLPNSDLLNVLLVDWASFKDAVPFIWAIAPWPQESDFVGEKAKYRYDTYRKTIDELRCGLEFSASLTTCSLPDIASLLETFPNLRSIAETEPWFLININPSLSHDVECYFVLNMEFPDVQTMEWFYDCRREQFERLPKRWAIKEAFILEINLDPNTFGNLNAKPIFPNPTLGDREVEQLCPCLELIIDVPLNDIITWLKQSPKVAESILSLRAVCKSWTLDDLAYIASTCPHLEGLQIELRDSYAHLNSPDTFELLESFDASLFPNLLDLDLTTSSTALSSPRPRRPPTAKLDSLTLEIQVRNADGTTVPRRTARSVEAYPDPEELAYQMLCLGGADCKYDLEWLQPESPPRSFRMGDEDERDYIVVWAETLKRAKLGES